MEKKLSVKSVVAIGVGAALFFVLAKVSQFIPSPIPNTSIITLQYGFIAFLSVLFGPIEGGAAAFIGHMLGDMASGYGVWWSWVITSGVFGLAAGFGCKGINIAAGIFEKADIARFNIAQAVAHLVCWVVVAPTLDVLMYKEPASLVYVQGITSFIGNAICTAVIGTILCVAYAKSRPQSGSLKSE